MRPEAKVDNHEYADTPALYRGGDDDAVYKVGDIVLEDGFYTCVPCGNKRYLKIGMRFPSCLSCFGKERKFFRKGLELWEKLVKIKRSKKITH